MGIWYVRLSLRAARCARLADAVGSSGSFCGAAWDCGPLIPGAVAAIGR